MQRVIVVMAALSLGLAAAATGQEPRELDRKLLFRLGGAPAGSETYRLERTSAGYRLSGDVDLSAMGLHVVQKLWVQTDASLAFRAAQVESTINGEPQAAANRS